MIMVILAIILLLLGWIAYVLWHRYQVVQQPKMKAKHVHLRQNPLTKQQKIEFSIRHPQLLTLLKQEPFQDGTLYHYPQQKPTILWLFPSMHEAYAFWQTIAHMLDQDLDFGYEFAVGIAHYPACYQRFKQQLFDQYPKQKWTIQYHYQQKPIWNVSPGYILLEVVDQKHVMDMFQQAGLHACIKHDQIAVLFFNNAQYPQVFDTLLHTLSQKKIEAKMIYHQPAIDQSLLFDRNIDHTTDFHEYPRIDFHFEAHEFQKQLDFYQHILGRNKTHHGLKSTKSSISSCSN